MSSQRPFARACLLLTVCLALAGPQPRSAQWIVDDDGPADFESIQSAIEAVYVHDGDILLVRPGRYQGNVVLSTKDLWIRSETGPWSTILDGEQSGSVVSLFNRTSASRIEGFTITNGRGQTGGGVWIFGGGPVITRNIVSGNAAVGGFLGYGYGGGIEVYSSAAVITRNVIRGNTALDGGGGIDVYYSGPSTPGTCCPLISQNTIAGNRVTGPAGAGGGVFALAAQPRLSSNILLGNVAGTGGGIYVYRVQGASDTPEAAVNLLWDNAPDDAAATGAWRLPSSNLHVDPRLGAGVRIDLSPRSDSPALDSAEPGLPGGADLAGAAAPADSDLDGSAAGDAGALENRGEITSLEVVSEPGQPQHAILNWDGSVNPAVVFNLYRSDMPPSSGASLSCLAGQLSLAQYVDPAPLPAGAVRSYLVTGRDVVEGIAGLDSEGAVGAAPPGCP